MAGIKTCIIPAAGRGSRWAPISGYLPKEMLPLVDKPVIEWVLGEVISSEYQKVIIVINKKKQLIKDYLVKHKKLNKNVDLDFIYQQKPQGLAHTFYLCRKKIGDNPFGVALPDLPTIAKVPVMKQLTHAYIRSNNRPHLVSLDKFPPQYLSIYSECLLEKENSKLFKIAHFCSKQLNTRKPHHPGQRLRMSGRFIFSPSIWPTLERLITDKDKKEKTDVDALHLALMNNQRILGFQITGHTYDTGTPESYVRANSAFFKKIITKNS